MKKTLLSMLALGLLFGAANFCPAQTDAKPLLTVSFSGYDKLLGNIDAIGQLSGNPDLGKQADMMLKMMTQGNGLEGLDAKQPWGGAVMPTQPFAIYGFLPVADLKQFMEAIKSNPQLEEVIRLNGEVYEIQVGGPTIYVKQSGKWAVLTDKSANLAKAPADPLKLLGDLPKRYDLAVRLSVANAPKEFRDQAVAALRTAAEVGLRQMPGESDEDYALRANMARQSLERFFAMVDDLDDLLLGWSLDPATKTTHLDVEITARAGTKLADRFGQMKPGKTDFAGLLMPNAALSAKWTHTLADADVAEAKNGLATVRKSLPKVLQKLPEGDAKLLAPLFGDVFDVLEKTVEARKIDTGLTLLLDPGAATVVAAGSIAEGAKLEKAVKQLADKIRQLDAEAAKSIKLDAETYEGVRFHAFSLPTPDEKLVPMVGKTLEVVLGIANDKLLVAAGRDAAKTLKKVLDNSKAAPGKEVSPVRIALAAGPIAKFIAQAADDQQAAAIARLLAETLEKADGKDHLVIASQPIPRGIRVRLEVEEGLLKGIVLSVGAIGPMGIMPMPR